MLKNVMKISKPDPNLARNDFDLSHRWVYSMNFGQLRVPLCLETVPDDYFEISASNLIRAIPMATSPFLRAKQHIDLWFVPITDLWHNFNQFIVGRKDPLGSAFKDYKYCPHVNIADIVDGIEYADTYSWKDIVGLDASEGMRIIFNDLRYGNEDRIYAQFADGKTFPDVNLWRVLAYNKIWYDEYRNKYYDDGTHLADGAWLNNPSGLWSVDDLDCSTYAQANVGVSSEKYHRIAPMFQMRYRQWKKDLFTGILPSTQFGAVSSVDILSSGYQAKFDAIATTSSSSDVTTASNGVVDFGSSVYKGTFQNLSVPNAFDVLALRKSEAIQKWRQIALMSGNSAWDNMRGHYGVTPDHDRDHRPTYIGSVDAPLNIGDINAQADIGNTGNQILGSVAGKGLSSINEHVFKFKANDFGIIMAISSLLPEAEYNSFGLDRMNQLIESDDYFKPEFQNLGLEAVGSFDFDLEDNASLSVLGYAPRYYGYKQKLDMVSSSFKYTGNIATMGQFAPWASPKYDILSSLGSVKPLSGLYVNPTIYNNNFTAGVAVSDEFMNDQFFDIKAVRPMSELGLPQF